MDAVCNMLEHWYFGRYVSCMNRRTTLPSLAVAAGFVALTGVALAKDAASTAAQHTLPGVDGDYHIVRPMPEPENADPLAGSQFKVGDMDVRIGGSITVDIGAGDLRRPR